MGGGEWLLGLGYSDKSECGREAAMGSWIDGLTILDFVRHLASAMIRTDLLCCPISTRESQ